MKETRDRYENISEETLAHLPIRFSVDDLILKILNNPEWNIFGLSYCLELFFYVLKDTEFLDFTSSDASGAYTGVLGDQNLSLIRVNPPIEIDDELVQRAMAFFDACKFKFIWQ